MGRFRQFIVEAPTSTTFWMSIPNFPNKIVNPISGQAIDMDENVYNMIFERISKYPEFKEKLKKIPVLPPMGDFIYKKLEGLKIPFWDMKNNEIFLVDREGNSYIAQNIEEINLCEDYKNFLAVAYIDSENKAAEFNPNLGKKVAQARILK